MVGPLTGMKTGIGPFFNTDSEVEEFEGGITRLREHAAEPSYPKDFYRHHYIATIDEEQELYLPPEAGQELMDAYRDDLDLSVVGERRKDGSDITLQGDISIGEEPAWTVRNIWDKNPNFSYHGRRIYAEPL